MKTEYTKVVVVGGGFAGIQVARSLAAEAAIQVTLVSKNNTFEYYPGLYKLVTGSLPIEVSVPLRHIVSGIPIRVVHGECTGVDRIARTVSLASGEIIAYDYVVLALGSEANYFNIPGLAERSFSFKSVSEALRLKRHLYGLFAGSATLSPEELKARLRIVIVGAGPSGVELAGSVKQYLKRVAKQYNVDGALISVAIIEAAPRILPMLSEAVSQKVTRRLVSLGIDIMTNQSVKAEDIDAITLNDTSMPTGTVIWTAGTCINSLYRTIPGLMFSEHKRVVVTDQLTLPDDERVFIAGDGAATMYSGLAQTAIQDGTFIAQHIRTLVRGNKNHVVYVPKQPAVLIPVGRYWGLFQYKGIVITGIIPRIMRIAADTHYFLGILPLHRVMWMWKRGWKYRHTHRHLHSVIPKI